MEVLEWVISEECWNVWMTWCDFYNPVVLSYLILCIEQSMLNCFVGHIVAVWINLWTHIKCVLNRVLTLYWIIVWLYVCFVCSGCDECIIMFVAYVWISLWRLMPDHCILMIDFYCLWCLKLVWSYFRVITPSIYAAVFGICLKVSLKNGLNIVLKYVDIISCSDERNGPAHCQTTQNY